MSYKFPTPTPMANLVVFHELVQNFTTTFGTDKVDITAHGYENDLGLKFTTSGSDLPEPFQTDPADTIYYVINKNNDDFEVSYILGGSKITITDDGTGTHTANPQFIVPDGVTRIFVEVYGGGGGGGAGRDNSSAEAGNSGSGGAGGVAEGFVIVTPGGTVAYTIGAGGNGGPTEGADGVNGSNSTFGSLTGNGGAKGNALQNGGAGGTASGGLINTPGGGGGAGGNATAETMGGSAGGSNKKGSGGFGSFFTTNAGDGGIFGGGGGGGGAGSSGGANFGAGGDGGIGGIIIWW